jgi:hypothetical protein
MSQSLAALDSDFGNLSPIGARREYFRMTVDTIVMTTELLIELDRTRYLREKKNGIVWSKGTCFIDFCLFCRLKFETGRRLIKLDFHMPA